MGSLAMKKRLLSLLVSLLLLVSLSPAALAAENTAVRETNFFTSQEHADLDYDEMTYVHMDTEQIIKEADAIRALCQDEANAAQAVERFIALIGQLLELATMDTLAYIRHSQNVMDTKAAEELAYCEAAYTEVTDAIRQLARDALLSPCGEIFKKNLSEEDAAYYLNYTNMSQELMALLAQELALETRYNQTAASLSVPYGGKDWTDNTAYFALAAGELSAEEYNTIQQAYVEKQNAALGEIYLEMIPLRRELAERSGYDSYPDYAYDVLYQRDFTPEDVRAFHKAVKEGGFYSIAGSLRTLASNGLDREVYYGDYTGDDTIELVEGYIKQMSSEMAEAYGYMRLHGLYDIKSADYKDGSGYTTILTSYGAPFFFNTPSGFFGDFTTMIHEFGHYNHFYWVVADLEGEAKSNDLAEVHSQGLELLFSHWYEDIFGESAQFAMDFLMANLVKVICEGALHDELQQYAYTTENVTLEQINRKYRQLCAEYGVVDQDDPREMMYDWVQIPHTFVTPCYYISYAVSSAGAFAFWLDAQQGEYFDAVDDYLRFTALPGELGFQASFEELEMDNPLAPDYLAELSKALRSELKLDERAGEVPPVDLKGSEWFAAAAAALYGAGVIEKGEDGRIRPRDLATWDDAASLVAHLTKKQPEVAKGDAAITRGEFVRLLVDELKLGEGVSPFSDTDDGAVGTLAEIGVVTGYDNGTFHPEQTISRAEMWVMVYRVLMRVVEDLLVGIAA